MKKLFFTFFVITGFYSFVSAQQSKGIELGLGVGYNGATVVSNDNQSTKSKSGFNAAFSVDNYFSNRWSLKVKAIYDQKGWGEGFLTVNTSSSSTTYPSVDYSLNYITVPVMANWHFGKTRNWYLDFGPYIGFLLDAKVSSGYNGSLKTLFNTTDGGLAYGIGIKLPVSQKTKFYIEFDGQSGVSNIFKYNASLTDVHVTRGSFNIGLNF